MKSKQELRNKYQIAVDDIIIKHYNNCLDVSLVKQTLDDLKLEKKALFNDYIKESINLEGQVPEHENQLRVNYLFSNFYLRICEHTIHLVNKEFF